MQSGLIVQAALELVNMWDLRHRQIGQLSGGQQQRIFLARALAQQVDIFLMDEPLTGVDKRSEQIISELLNELRSRTCTRSVTHLYINCCCQPCSLPGNEARANESDLN